MSRHRIKWDKPFDYEPDYYTTEIGQWRIAVWKDGQAWTYLVSHKSSPMHGWGARVPCKTRLTAKAAALRSLNHKATQDKPTP